VGEVGDLLLHRIDDPLVAIADTGDGDAGAEVDELVAIDIAQDPVLSGLDIDRQAGAHPRRLTDASFR
jgi:hypothetical protein